MSVSTIITSITVLIQLVIQVLKKDCVAALRRIFKLCDTNKDGILDAAELNEFQVSQTARASTGE